MLPYLKLQQVLLHRRLTEFGLPAMLAWPAVALAWAGLCLLVMWRAPQPGWMLAGLGLLPVMSLSGQARIDFLRVSFPRRMFWRIRLLENLLAAMPTAVFLLVTLNPLQALALCIAAVLLLPLRLGRRGGWVIPTPFGRWPFEHVVGFRRTYLLLPLLAFVAYQAVRVQNANLGMATLVALWLVMAAYHGSQEHEHFVRVHLGGPARFLRRKLVVALALAQVWALPLAVALVVCFPALWLPILLTHLCGMAYLATWLLVRYAHYPAPLGLLPSLLLVAALLMPPLMLFFVPHFYARARRALQPFLS